jgi:hypothetical protein
VKNLTWQNPEQLFVAQVLINKVKSKCCGIKDNKELSLRNKTMVDFYISVIKRYPKALKCKVRLVIW